VVCAVSCGSGAKYKGSGELIIQCNILRQHSFLDYVKGGMQVLAAVILLGVRVAGCLSGDATYSHIPL